MQNWLCGRVPHRKISQNRQNRKFSAYMGPEKAAGESSLSGNCRAGKLKTEIVKQKVGLCWVVSQLPLCYPFLPPRPVLPAAGGASGCARASRLSGGKRSKPFLPLFLARYIAKSAQC